MLCEKCGKSNSDTITVCKHCKALMPLRDACGGFGDVLSYTPDRKTENETEIVKQLTQALQQAEMAEQQTLLLKKKNKHLKILAWICILVAVVTLLHVGFTISRANKLTHEAEEKIQILQNNKADAEE